MALAVVAPVARRPMKSKRTRVIAGLIIMMALFDCL
jgi:hypothetical protein